VGIVDGATYTQTMGYQTNGTFKVKNLLDDAIDMIEIEYADLVALRNSSGLTSGMQYRITDFVTTVHSGLTTTSAGHPFDIIAFADDESTLNENVRFIQQEGDTYFANSNLAAWEGKYTIDNDPNRFDWAAADGSGKGVIYYLKDEFDNECGYDFKNVLYNGITFPNTATTINNVYTFCITGATNSDASLSSSNKVNNNVIPCLTNNDGNGSLILNETIFFGTENYNNTFGKNAYLNKFGPSTYRNVFGDDCSGNTFTTNCEWNHVGNYCCNNFFNADFRQNTIGNGFQENQSTSAAIENNTFNTSCHKIQFNTGGAPASFEHNTFDSHVNYLDFSANYTNGTIMNVHFLSGGHSSGPMDTVPATITLNANYPQFAGFDSNGNFTVVKPLG
jgi:hypothetical protein